MCGQYVPGQSNNALSLGVGHVALDPAAFIGRKSIGDEPLLRLPDPTFNAGSLTQAQLQNYVEQIRVDRLVVGSWRLRSCIAIADGAAGLYRGALGIVDLNASALTVDLEHDEPKRKAGCDNEEPEEAEPGAQGTDGHRVSLARMVDRLKSS